VGIDEALSCLAVLQANGERRMRDLELMAEEVRRSQADQRRRLSSRVLDFVCRPLRWRIGRRL
jgi:hypothetical protein